MRRSQGWPHVLERATMGGGSQSTSAEESSHSALSSTFGWRRLHESSTGRIRSGRCDWLEARALALGVRRLTALGGQQSAI